jgi:hypothetical protein
MGDPKMKTLNRSKMRILATAGLATAVAAPMWAGAVLAAEDNGGALDPESLLHKNWSDLMARTPTPDEGCFHASYPNIVWENVDCKTGPGRAHPVRATAADNKEEVVGNGNDYVAQAKGLITLASGGFSIKGVTSETGVGVAGFHDAGILGPNEYSLQINTNAKETTSACAGHSGCTVWQQFVYSPNYNTPGEAAVLMQYWLIGWGSSSCPKGGWWKSGSDCVKNSAYVPAPDVPITNLGKIGLMATASAGGNDQVTFSDGSDSYSITGKDSVLDISSVWNKAEFNVVGNAGGSRADFNKGSSITVTLLLFDGSTSAPKCVADDGTTGETNNLNLGTCTAYGGIPNIQFTESN